MRRSAAVALGAVLWAGVSACGPSAAVTVLRATYGRSCGQALGNVTWAVERACGGRPGCDLLVAPVILGDPVEGCAKDFEVLWACHTGDTGVRRASVPAETSNGAVVRLVCE